jgi:hypothetical protein
MRTKNNNNIVLLHERKILQKRNTGLTLLLIYWYKILFLKIKKNEMLILLIYLNFNLIRTNKNYLNTLFNRTNKRID